MRCPSCTIEIGPGEDTCSGCGAATGATRQERGREESLELVCVLRTTDSLHLLLAKSVLDAAGIPLVVQGEQGLALFPVGPLGSRVTKRALGASILVPRGRAAEARELLETPAEPPSDSDWNTDQDRGSVPDPDHDPQADLDVDRDPGPDPNRDREADPDAGSISDPDPDSGN